MSVLDRTTTILWKHFSDKGFQVLSADSSLPLENTIAFVLSIPKELEDKAISNIDIEDVINLNSYIQKLGYRFSKIDLLRFEIRKKDILLSILIRFKKVG
jgi:hypothetical protein